MSISLSTLVQALETIAPLELAEPWDNVGLLVDPRLPGCELSVERVLLAIDATDEVLKDPALGENACLVAYHPPLFTAVKRASAQATPALVQALRRNFAIYSPHTALDATAGGLNDWLAEAFGDHDALPLVPKDQTRVGAGRLVTLRSPLSLDEVLDRLKRHLGLSRLRLASRTRGAPIQRVALCAGSGGSLFQPVTGVDLYLTGEMRHHDVLEKLAHGASVILCEHSSSERGYLPRLCESLRCALGDAAEFLIASADVEPIESV